MWYPLGNTREKSGLPKSTNFTISQKMAGCSVEFKVRRREGECIKRLARLHETLAGQTTCPSMDPLLHSLV